ncbi:Cytochrome c556 [Palleronia salina]|uniref:Cytochrome c556 n=1 Tax=Palleronia salina TaxID=313368 RepID=A0A1M6BCJ7_9RHOB|nr:cytochrome c [Palleronia salina]SHI46173.1 Cytochrome c556 [Palleronia salina]
MKITTTLAAIAMTGTAVAALAHSGATGIVKERMDAMKAMGDAVKSVAPMMRGEMDYDADAMRAAARTFQEHAGDAMTELFPEGSGGMPSEAKDAVWEDWDAFAELADRLAVYAEGLEGAAGNGMGQGGQMDTGAMMGGDAGSMMGGGSMMGDASGMMGGSAMMGEGGSGMMTAEHIAEMPTDAAFTMTTEVCSACHSRFRAEDG